MNLLEYEAKNILQNYHVSIPDGQTFHQGDQSPSVPIVLKSQVHTGGRGKLGGVRIVTNPQDLSQEIDKIFSLSIKGEQPQTILAEEVIDISREYYLSFVINRSLAAIELIAYIDGGIEIESHGNEALFRKIINPDTLESLGESLAEYFSLENKSFLIQDVIENLYTCFVESDAMLLEINPLVVTNEGNLVAGDCKMTLDPSAAFRHPEWKFEQAPSSANFVTLDPAGTVATIANGAGLAMATVDAVESAGLKPVNFLDIGGGATVDGIIKSFETILKFPLVNAIVINIFGGIVRCDDVAKAIIEARTQFTNLPKLYIRLSGTRSAEANQLLSSQGLTLYPDLPSCIKELSR